MDLTEEHHCGTHSSGNIGGKAKKENFVIELRANKGPTGRLLRQLLQEKGLLARPGQTARGVVNYGHGGASNLPTLNARAGTFNKYVELETLAQKGVSTVPFARRRAELPGVALGRRIHHTRGTDIVVIRAGQPHTGSDFYTALIPKRREFRVWGFRRKPIATYEKVLTYPVKLGRRGRSRDVWNWRNGYAYNFLHPEAAPKALKGLGAAAVDALGLDFGAVDIIEGHDGRFYCLEVNTAPGVEGPRWGLTSLARHIELWAQGGYKRRNGEARQ